MNKPISIIYEEFKQELATLINNSGLPPFMLESILQNYLNEVSVLTKNQYRIDKIQYEKTEKKRDTSNDDGQKD